LFYVSINFKDNIEEDLEEGVQMVRDLQDLKLSLNQKIKEDESFQLFENMDLNLEQKTKKKDKNKMSKKLNEIEYLKKQNDEVDMNLQY
jgi:hypothetical protein